MRHSFDSYIFSLWVIAASMLLGKYSPVNSKKLNNIVMESIYDIKVPIDGFITSKNGVFKTVQWMQCEDDA